LRARFPGITNLGELYVDRVILGCSLPPGRSSVLIDDLQLAPIVPPRAAASPTPIGESTTPTEPPVSFQLDRLLVAERPFFPRMIRYHGEPPELLKRAGVNVVWIPDWTDAALIRRLRQHDLWVTAEPPRPQDESGDALRAASAGLVPFGSEADGILYWMLGTRLNAADKPRVADWIEQLEFADRRRARPIAADIAADEWSYSRDLKLVGLSRHPLQSTFTLQDYRDWLTDRRNRVRPGAFCWTWIQTEPTSRVVDAASTTAAKPQLEPEQLRLQVYAALAAGYRGIGYWTTSRLDSDGPGAEETFLAIQQMNQELQLLEPWLSTATSGPLIACQLPATDGKSGLPSRNVPFGTSLPQSLERSAQLRSREAELRRSKHQDQEVAAAVLRTELGTLILPMWLERQSQFVPAQSAAANVTLVIPGSEQAAAVCELSPVHLHGLESQRVAGGLQVRLPRLDQTAIIWLTSELSKVDWARQRIATGQADAAATAVGLARRKLDRVGLIDQELQPIGPSQPDAPQILGRAKLRLDSAQAALSGGDAHRAWSLSTEVLQHLRTLQRAHWDDAVRERTSPVSSPDTLCFQTLPDHWRLMADVGRSRGRSPQNLLRSGDFEDLDTLIAEQWHNVHTAPAELRTSAELFPQGRGSRHSLRLVCEPAAGVTALPPLSDPMMSVTTPGMLLRAGQIVYVSGWVKITTPITGSRDGLMLSDSLLGRTQALRFHAGSDWQRFELIRRVTTSADLKLTLSLMGPGDALIDDLQVVSLDPRSTSADSANETDIEQTSGMRLMDRLPKLPRFVPLPGRGGDDQKRPPPGPRD
jgi:hypothetical protein